MARAAYCSQCGTNVWVTEDGRCPKGHGPESLSNFYEAPPAPGAAAEQAPLSPADAAIAEAASSGAGRNHKTLTIVLTVIAVLVLCGLSTCVATCVWAGGTADDAADSVSIDTEALEEAAQEQADAPPSEEELSQEFADSAAADLDRMVQYFYPNFTLAEYYLVSNEDENGTATFHAIAAYNGEPAFLITFFAQRSSADTPVGSDNPAQAYYDEEAGVWWLHPQTREHGLDSVFGPDPLMVDSMMQQIATDFVAAHPTKLVSDISALTNVDLGFQGIDESEIIDWYDDGESFESTWKYDIPNSKWVEIDYTEF